MPEILGLMLRLLMSTWQSTKNSSFYPAIYFATHCATEFVTVPGSGGSLIANAWASPAARHT